MGKELLNILLTKFINQEVKGFPKLSNFKDHFKPILFNHTTTFI
jgi:hypothetical protein